jgi:hypothetical protein
VLVLGFFLVSDIETLYYYFSYSYYVIYYVFWHEIYEIYEICALQEGFVVVVSPSVITE